MTALKINLRKTLFCSICSALGVLQGVQAQAEQTSLSPSEQSNVASTNVGSTEAVQKGPQSTTNTTPNTGMTAEIAAEVIQPLTQAEIQAGLNKMQKWMIGSIEEWGKTLKAEDFERTWTGGRILVKQKRQEVCGIYQRIVNETYKLALDNRLRLPEKDQAVLQDRNAFIQSLGYRNNIVDTKMGFNCRLK